MQSNPEQKDRLQAPVKQFQAQKISADDITLALYRNFFGNRNLIFPNVLFHRWEIDFAVVTPAGYLSEFEIKTSAQDWKADLKKDKWSVFHVRKFRDRVARFYYVVPYYLVDKMPHIPEWMGVITVGSEYDKYFINYHRQCQRQKAIKLTNEEIEKMLLSLHYRFWDLKIKLLSKYHIRSLNF